MSKGSVLLWFGSQPNQRALANKLAEKFNIAGIVIEKRTGGKPLYSPKKIFNSIIDRLLFNEIRKSWSALMKKYDRDFPSWPEAEILETPTINSENAIEFSKSRTPDLILVSGTSLVRKEMLSSPTRLGIMNLHTGLSPYVKGGPNCTNWCIANGEFHLIGNTVMWIDPGIDSGRIISSERVDPGGNNTLSEIHIKVMESAHELYIRSANHVMNSADKIKGVGQDTIAKGMTYYTRDWNNQMKYRLLKNMPKIREAIESGKIKEQADSLVLIELQEHGKA